VVPTKVTGHFTTGAEPNGPNLMHRNTGRVYFLEVLNGAILFAVTEFLGTGSQVPLLLVIDAI
jgi:hypothetical protein